MAKNVPSDTEEADEGDLRARSRVAAKNKKQGKPARKYTDTDAVNKAALGSIPFLAGGGPEAMAAKGLERFAARKGASTAAKTAEGAMKNVTPKALTSGKRTAKALTDSRKGQKALTTAKSKSPKTASRYDTKNGTWKATKGLDKHHVNETRGYATKVTNQTGKTLKDGKKVTSRAKLVLGSYPKPSKN